VRKRIITLLTACLLAITAGSFLTANTASATTGVQFCDVLQCLNAWNGGPYVNTYGPRVANDFFNLTINTLPDPGYRVIQYLGPGSYHGDCISDYNNSSTDARAGLYDCSRGGYPWGSKFEVANCPSGALAFYDIHWNGWLAPAGPGNGKGFYLNNPTEHCFDISEFTFLG